MARSRAVMSPGESAMRCPRCYGPMMMIKMKMKKIKVSKKIKMMKVMMKIKKKMKVVKKQVKVLIKMKMKVVVLKN